MCGTCGCNEAHHHEHSHGDHHHSPQKIDLEIDVLSRNKMMAERNRGVFEAKKITALNFVSSPGAGKTSLLVKTLNDLKKEFSFYVIEGDQQTTNDADRIKETGVSVKQINTGSGCHLDAAMINQSIKEFDMMQEAFLMIENVGNLVCPAMFDLGEAKRIVIISVTEGDDKPLKYPYIFETSDLCLINKTDLLPYVDCNITKIMEYGKKVNPHLEFIDLSCKTGKGLNNWYGWLKKLEI